MYLSVYISFAPATLKVCCLKVGFVKGDFFVVYGSPESALHLSPHFFTKAKDSFPPLKYFILLEGLMSSPLLVFVCILCVKPHMVQHS